MMVTNRTVRGNEALTAFLAVSSEQWASTPALWEQAKRLYASLPAELEPARVREFLAKLMELSRCPAFSAQMPSEHFPVYAQWRIERAQAAMAAHVSEDLVSSTAFLFAWRGDPGMCEPASRAFDDVERLRLIERQRLVDTHERFVAIPYFKHERFKPLADSAVILDAARITLANPWFLERCAQVERGEARFPRFDIKLWAACKLVLRLAGESVSAPGPEPLPLPTRSTGARAGRKTRTTCDPAAPLR